MNVNPSIYLVPSAQFQLLLTKPIVSNSLLVLEQVLLLIVTNISAHTDQLSISDMKI